MTKQPEHVRDLLWRGKLQLGDEPGIYGDAQYGGLSMEVPVELFPYSGQFQSEGLVQIGVRARDVKVYEGFPGHPVVLFGFFQADGKMWTKKQLAATRLTTDTQGTAILTLKGPIPRYVSLQVSTDISIQPGLFDEMIVEEIWLDSVTHYGFLGFRFQKRPRKETS